MIRASSHILKYQTKHKTEELDYLTSEFQFLVQKYIDLIWCHKLELKPLLSSKLLPSSNNITHSRWKQLAYKTASEMVRSVINRKSKKKTKPIFNRVSINIDERFLDFQEGNEFDEWIKIKLPFFKDGIKRAKTISIPINHHKHSNKYRLDKTFQRKKTIKLLKKNGYYFIEFSWEGVTPKLKENGVSIGMDSGYKKLLVDSDGNQYGKELESIYEKISRKKQNSKAFKRSLKERNNKIGEVCNKINFKDKKEIVVENLKYVKHKSKGRITKKFNNKLQRWIYRAVLCKLERMSQENGVLFTQVNPAYTSQTCSNCQTSNKASRKGENYKCVTCGNQMDADFNAAINILHKGVYSPLINKTKDHVFHDFK